jgi:cytochrome c oxidase subunit 2
MMETQLKFSVRVPAGIPFSRPFALRSVLLAALLAFISGAAAADGKAIFTGSCFACHGAKGEGNSKVGAPNIAGMDVTYLNRQLSNFAAGIRGASAGEPYAAQMRAAVAVLKTDDDRKAVAAYVAALPKVRFSGDIKGNLANGSTQFNAVCSSCHEGHAQGNLQMGAPALVGVDPAYMERQVLAFRDGSRGAHKDDKNGALMRVGANMVPDAKSVHDVVAYINSLQLAR